MASDDDDSPPPSWDTSAEDFGQKVDLTVRIREILRNYPEGLSILKELLQNADDAGARVVKFCVAESRPPSSSSTGSGGAGANKLSNLMSGPSLLAYNSAQFTTTDFQSIQRIGDSLKKDTTGTKTGRFGVGVNSTYHLTDVPLFISGTKVVLFDPQAEFVPGINPANPGKMIDLSKKSGRELVGSLPSVFDPLRCFGCRLDGNVFDGTMFRFALRTEGQAETSRLSRQSHSLDNMRELMQSMAQAASGMLLFLKNVERIELYDWSSDEMKPTLVHVTNVLEPNEKLRKRRRYMLDCTNRVPTKPVSVDYIMDICSHNERTSKGGAAKREEVERWIVCNQLGGGTATSMSSDPTLKHMRLVPWAGVAAKLSLSDPQFDGNAYCFLPLPVSTHLPVHVNGYFELSSNRRDIWWGEDMAGDGKARAMWNRALLEEVAGPSYCRLLLGAIQAKQVDGEGYERFFPMLDASQSRGGLNNNGMEGPWEVLASRFYAGIQNLPVLHSTSVDGSSPWVTPTDALLMDKDIENESILASILSMEKLPLVLLQTDGLRKILLSRIAIKTSTPVYIRQHFRSRAQRSDGALEHPTKKIVHAEYLLKYSLSDLHSSQYGTELSGCQFVPLANGQLGTLLTLTSVEQTKLIQLQSMGFPKLRSLHALRRSGSNVDVAFEWLLENKNDNGGNSGREQIHNRLDPYLLASGPGANLIRSRSAQTLIDSDALVDPVVQRFFTSKEVAEQLNVLELRRDMLADVVSMVLPTEWCGVECAPWTPTDNSSSGIPDVDWFKSLWRYICLNDSVTDTSAEDCSHAGPGGGDGVGQSLRSIAENYCLVPTNQNLVCTLSPSASVLETTGLNDKVVQSVIALGGRRLLANVLPNDLIIPKEIWSYIFQPTREGVVRTIEASVRRHSLSIANAKDSFARRSGGRAGSVQSASPFDSISNEIKVSLYDFLANTTTSGPISKEAAAALRTFPIFRVYNSSSDDDENNNFQDAYSSRTAAADEADAEEADEEPETPKTKFVSLISANTFYVLENATLDDAHLMNDEFLYYESSNEMQFLVDTMGAHKMDRAQFYIRFVLPQLPDLTESIRKLAVTRILTDLSTLSSLGSSAVYFESRNGQNRPRTKMVFCDREH